MDLKLNFTDLMSYRAVLEQFMNEYGAHVFKLRMEFVMQDPNTCTIDSEYLFGIEELKAKIFSVLTAIDDEEGLISGMNGAVDAFTVSTVKFWPSMMVSTNGSTEQNPLLDCIVGEFINEYCISNSDDDDDEEVVDAWTDDPNNWGTDDEDYEEDSDDE